MSLTVFEEVLREVLLHAEKKSFPQLISDCRNALGIKTCKACELIGVPKSRLNNLESGLFKTMPSYGEIVGLSRMYCIDPRLLVRKASEYIKHFPKKKGTCCEFCLQDVQDRKTSNRILLGK